MKKINLVIGIFILLSMAGCSSNSTPTCSDVNVKKIVLKIANEELFKQLLPDELQRNYSQLIEEIKNSALYKEYEQIDPQGAGFVWGTMPVNNFMKFVEISQTAKVIKERISQQIKEKNLSLAGIRISGETTDVNRISCESNLILADGNTLPIRYTAQLTADNQVWVEVSGL